MVFDLLVISHRFSILIVSCPNPGNSALNVTINLILNVLSLSARKVAVSHHVPFPWPLSAPCWTPWGMPPALRQVLTWDETYPLMLRSQKYFLLFLGSQTDVANTDLDSNSFCKSLLLLSATD